MSQSRRMSVLETTVSTAAGFLLSMLVLEVVNQLWNLRIGLVDNLAITCIFTILSLVRGYFIRRLFNWWHEKSTHRMG